MTDTIKIPPDAFKTYETIKAHGPISAVGLGLIMGVSMSRAISRIWRVDFYGKGDLLQKQAQNRKDGKRQPPLYSVAPGFVAECECKRTHNPGRPKAKEAASEPTQPIDIASTVAHAKIKAENLGYCSPWAGLLP